MPKFSVKKPFTVLVAVILVIVLGFVSLSGMQTDLLPKLAQAGLPLYATALREDTVDLREMDLRRCAIAIGSEGRGVSQAVLDASAKTVKIPMAEQCESLNAAIAGAVVLWQMGFGR